VTITSGAGADVIVSGDGDDTINAGNGANSITGGLGIDTITGGTDVDTFVFLTVADSQGVTVDVITNFDVTEDILDFSAVTAGGAYLGEANGYGAVLTSLTGTAGDVVLDTTTNTVYVDVDGNGALDNADFAVKLTGVTDLSTSNFTL
jgi:serralysin